MSVILNSYSSILTSSQYLDTASLDDPMRTKYLRSCWHGFIHRKEKRQLNEKIMEKVTAFFQQRYDLQDHDIFNQVWKEIGAKIWTPNLALTAGKLRAIDQAFQNQLVYHGVGITFPSRCHPQTDKVIQQVVQTLLHGQLLTAEVLQKRLLQAVFVKKDAELLRQVRLELQREMDLLAEHLPKNDKEEVIWRAFLGNIVALLPYTYPTDKDTFVLPMLSNGCCRRVEYSIQVLPLTPSAVTSPLIALGLTPKDDDKASPILSFTGTTYPAGDGFIATILSDFTAGHSVGEAAYQLGKNKIETWLEGKKEVHVVGTSLGGALAFHTLCNHPEKLGRIDVYNPPGLYSWNWKGEFNHGCDIHIYSQDGDLVSQMGVWPVGAKVSLYHVSGHQKGVSNGWISSHARAYTGCEKVTVLKQDPKVENKTWLRKMLTILHLVAGPLAFLLSCGGLFFLYWLLIKIRYTFFLHTPLP
jgi:hypothetical protein